MRLVTVGGRLRLVIVLRLLLPSLLALRLSPNLFVKAQVQTENLNTNQASRLTFGLIGKAVEKSAGVAVQAYKAITACQAK